MRFPDTLPPFAQGMNAYRDTASSRGGRYHFTTTSLSVLSVS